MALMPGDIHGVRIVPREIVFKNAVPSVPIKQTITVKNVSKSSLKIRMYAPEHKDLCLYVENSEVAVPPGLEVTARVVFTGKPLTPAAAAPATDHAPSARVDDVTPAAADAAVAEICDRIIVTVDAQPINVAITVLPKKADIIMDNFVDFGEQVANSRVVVRKLTIRNSGSKAGNFRVNYNGSSPLTVVPRTGSIAANSSLVLKLEYVTKSVAVIDENVIVHIEGLEDRCIHVVGKVDKGCLRLVDIDTQRPITCVRFGSSYYGTDQTRAGILFNDSPNAVEFVVVLDEDAVGQEIGIKKLQGNKKYKHLGSPNDLTTLFTALPNQGRLEPYEKMGLFFRFSPRWNESSTGFKCTKQPPLKQDFSVFMCIQVIGASNGFQNPSLPYQGVSLEIALTATSLPVLLELKPTVCDQHRPGVIDFGSCKYNQTIEMSSQLKNNSTKLPLAFQFRKLAHFSCDKNVGRLNPSENVAAILRFRPQQLGSFLVEQVIDVLGPVADSHNPFRLAGQVIHSLAVAFEGVCEPVTRIPRPVFNPALTPLITNETGLFCDVSDFPQMDLPPMTHAPKATRRRLAQEEKNVKLAMPNDLSRSIRPSDNKYRSLFLGLSRYTYIDPDYAYTKKEMTFIETHRQYYEDYLKFLKESRVKEINKKQFDATHNDVDIDIVPAQGLRPLQLNQREIFRVNVVEPKVPNTGIRLLSIKELAKSELNASSKVCQGLNAVPCNSRQKRDCLAQLSPRQLHQIIIGPPTIDFGVVCTKSINEQSLNIVNNLDQYIHVVISLGCLELRQSSPLSQVIPPQSSAPIPLLFESLQKGRFQRSISYTVNRGHTGHVTVFADVADVSLELSQSHLCLEPYPGQPADLGIRGIVTLKNKLNFPAEFSWSPIVDKLGMAFTIRPASGVVDSKRNLDCEVVFNPTFVASDRGKFTLNVLNGQSKQFTCNAKLGTPSLQLVDKRISFGNIPLNLSTERFATIKNTGLYHAYYKIDNPTPIDGILTTPITGSIPSGGTCDIAISMLPRTIHKFDARVYVDVRGGKQMEIRVGGTVEMPSVNINIPNFNFGGIYCGSSNSVEFQLTNKESTKAFVDFDFKQYRDFAISIPNMTVYQDHYSVTMEPLQSLDCILTFAPKEVASYEFLLPVRINNIAVPHPPKTPFPASPYPVKGNPVASTSPVKTKSVNTGTNGQYKDSPDEPQHPVNTPSKKVIATARRQPFLVSKTDIKFHVAFNSTNSNVAESFNHSQICLIVNNTKSSATWTLDTSQAYSFVEAGIFKFLHSTGMPYMVMEGQNGISGKLEVGETVPIHIIFVADHPGTYRTKLPLLLNDEVKPVQIISLQGEFTSPRLTFDPVTVVMPPVPLGVSTSFEVTMHAKDYKTASNLKISLPEVEIDDVTIKPISVVFEHDFINIKPEKNGGKSSYSMKVNFCSKLPLSFHNDILFTDDYGAMFKLPVTATSDNCLLSCYPFIAKHRLDHQIVCQQGMTKSGNDPSEVVVHSGQAMLVPLGRDEVRQRTAGASSERPSTLTTSSFDHRSIDEFAASQMSSDHSNATALSANLCTGHRQPSTTSCNSTLEATSVLAPTGDSSCEDQLDNLRFFLSSSAAADVDQRSLNSDLFPRETDGETAIFHREVLMTVQRWFSSQGLPDGPSPILIPDTLRESITKSIATGSTKGMMSTAQAAIKKPTSIYDVIGYLSGRLIPGIPVNQSLPSDNCEVVRQIHWQHNTLLAFLRGQGACVSTILPEHLLTFKQYETWKEICQLVKDYESEHHLEESMPTRVDAWLVEGPNGSVDERLFEQVSRRAWCEVLLQLLKVFVLAKVTPRALKQQPTPYGPRLELDPHLTSTSSNIYGVGERVLLVWMNHHFEKLRKVVWQNKQTAPASRWIVNFDNDLLDGLVLATILAAYAPYLIESHLLDMYTSPKTAEECLHNALKVVAALRFLHIDYDIQAIDITDPNPIAMLLLVLHLFSHLPSYLIRGSIEFTGPLHAITTRQIKLNNPTMKSLSYVASITGKDKHLFSLPLKEVFNLPRKAKATLSIDYNACRLSSSRAILILVGHRQGPSIGSTLVFNLKSCVDNVRAKQYHKVEAGCYTSEQVNLTIRNPYNCAGEFTIRYIESDEPLLSPEPSVVVNARRKLTKNAASRTDHGQPKIKVKINDSPDKFAVCSSPTKDRFEQKMPLLYKHMNSENTALPRFFGPSSVNLAASSTKTIQVNFLPHSVGRHFVTIIFSHPILGEFIHSLEGIGTTPLPLKIPYEPNVKTCRIPSDATSKENCGVIHWRCDINQRVLEMLRISIVNENRENALIHAIQLGMSDLELKRRKETGTLQNPCLLGRALKVIANENRENLDSAGEFFTIDCDNKLFQVPSKLRMPKHLRNAPTNSLNTSAADEFIDLPIEFQAPNVTGVHTANITVRNGLDTRLYTVECSVNTPMVGAKLTFTSPVHQTIRQSIPITNHSAFDWPIQVKIIGDSFSGPSSFIASCYQINNYPLTFNPLFEGTVKGVIEMLNTYDGVVYKFELTGIGEKPFPVDTIRVQCSVNDVITRILQVPNTTDKRVDFTVESDFSSDMTSGDSSVTVLSRQSTEYRWRLRARKRGHFRGVLAFVAKPDNTPTYDSDGDEEERRSPAVPENALYRVWYALDVEVTPRPPETKLAVSCHCQQSTTIEINVTNPSTNTMTLQSTVLIGEQDHGITLQGAEYYHIKPESKTPIHFDYSPSIVGVFTASIILYNETCGEFWYQVTLTALSPLPVALPLLRCQLGQSMDHVLTVKNPTHQPLLLTPMLSNTQNYSLVLGDEESAPLWKGEQLHLGVRESRPLTLVFTPTTVADEQCTKLTFNCKQLGQWTFLASGVGELPVQQSAIDVIAPASTNSTIIIPFRNPTEENVLVDINLLSAEKAISAATDIVPQRVQDENIYQETEEFSLVMAKSSMVEVKPNESCDIVLAYSPMKMQMAETLVKVDMRRESGMDWKFSSPNMNKGSDPQPMPTSLSAISWTFPVRGYPEIRIQGRHVVEVKVKSRQRHEQRLEVVLSGLEAKDINVSTLVGDRQSPTGEAGQSNSAPSSPAHYPPCDQPPSFTFDLIALDSQATPEIESAVAIKFIRRMKDEITGLVMLVFNVVFAPYRTMNNRADLIVQSNIGGQWRFPMRFVSTPAAVDDTLVIEAAGLNKISHMMFKLYSITSHPSPFTAFFVAGSDKQFTVSPTSGELLPRSSEGTMITVSFNPSKYGQLPQAKLVIQTTEMQWTYAIRGTLPEYCAPTSVNPQVSTSGCTNQRRINKVNYLTANLALTSTAQSSPIKGAPLLRTK